MSFADGSCAAASSSSLCCNALMTISRSFFLTSEASPSRHCSPRTSQPVVGTALSVLLMSSCCWVRSSGLLLAMLFCLLLAVLFCVLIGLCHFVQLSQLLVDLLLVVVQVLRFCAPFRQSGYASLVNFFSSLALLAVILSLFSVLCLLVSPPPALLCGSLRLRGSLLASSNTTTQHCATS